MGVISSCRSGCAWTETGVTINTPDGTLFRIGIDTTLTLKMSWTNASFPFAPCPDPQSSILWYRKWNGTGWSAWKKVASSVASCASTSADVGCTTAASWSASSGVVYSKELFWCSKGVYQILWDHPCTGGGLKGMKARRKRVVVV